MGLLTSKMNKSSVNKMTTLKFKNLFGSFSITLYILFIGLPILALIIKGLTNGLSLNDILSPTSIQSIKLSLLTSGISVLVIIIVGTPVAYVISRSNSLALRILDICIELPIILPPIVAGVAMLMAFGRQGILGGFLNQIGIQLPFTMTAVIFAQIFVSAPFYIRAARISFAAVDQNLEELSVSLGVSPLATFWKITLPLTWSGLITGLALTWARSLSEFGATIMFAGNMMGETQTMPLGILMAMETNLNTAITLSLVLLTISLIILIGLSVLSNKFSNGNRR
jgi:molybdate transport system permease protein|tara:strand:- start:1 stop:849 length:849 start_codon:yes stop_codon:yes gene_type:complete